MSDWTQDQLATIDGAGELRVAAQRRDGSVRTPTIVWHVVADGQLFLRSVRGDAGAWYRAVQRTGAGTIDAGGVHAEVLFHRDALHDDAIDRAYRAKYGHGSAVRAITAPAAVATTLRIDPR